MVSRINICWPDLADGTPACVHVTLSTISVSPSTIPADLLLLRSISLPPPRPLRNFHRPPPPPPPTNPARCPPLPPLLTLLPIPLRPLLLALPRAFASVQAMAASRLGCLALGERGIPSDVRLMDLLWVLGEERWSFFLYCDCRRLLHSRLLYVAAAVGAAGEGSGGEGGGGVGGAVVCLLSFATCLLALLCLRLLCAAAAGGAAGQGSRGGRGRGGWGRAHVQKGGRGGR